MPAIPILFSAVAALLRNSRALLSLAGLVMAVGFSGKLFVHELAESALKLWWLAAMACAVLLVRAYIREYFKLKREVMKETAKNESHRV